ncbi:MAG TPA: hypothetical protein VD994_10925, partial [Prosthecobacter sp.]|nr:hypothetical protein [Prosthecobacter sp.]
MQIFLDQATNMLLTREPVSRHPHMTCLPKLRLILLPALALLTVFGATSCSTTDYYFGSPAVGGGFYVNQVRPTWNKARWGIHRFGKRVPDMMARVTGRNDDSFWNGDDMPGKPS